MAKSAGNLVLVGDVVEQLPAGGAAAAADRPAVGAAVGLRARRPRRAPRPGWSGCTPPRRGGPTASPSATGAVTGALATDLDVPAALAVAEEDGGAAARLALSVLGLS